MAKNGVESTSDGLEIVSIGALYAGPWDKKYWSSSRGKDRYPYPIGYQALRTHKGLTYKMEVHEGTKGPVFQITSNDKQSGSGETPDRAWGNFQKKCCSRVKLLHGKRFSGKVDGVEFFGFKNSLVQRLLRELVATINDAPDQSSLFANFNKASVKAQDVGLPIEKKSPEVMSFLEKTRVTGKRSRTCRDVDTKSARKKSHKKADVGKDPCHTRSSNTDEPLISSTSNLGLGDQADGPLLVLSEVELEKHVSLSGNGLPVKSAEVLVDLKAKLSSTEGQSEVANMEKSPASLVNVNLPQDEEMLHRQCIREVELGLPVQTEEKDGKAHVVHDVLDSTPPVLTDSLVNPLTDSCAHDTLDTQQDVMCPPDSGRGRGESPSFKSGLVADMIFSEEAISGSHSEDGSCYLTNSEKSDFDSVGEDMVNPMLAFLLPRAIPLLTYSSRKKKRKTRPSKELSCGLKCDDKLVGTIPSSDVISPAGTHAKSGVEGVKRAHTSSVSVDPVRLVLGNVKNIVPDSLDDDQSEDHDVTNLPQSSNNAEEVVVVVQDNREPYGENSFHSLHAAELSNHNYKTSGCKENSSHEELPKNSDMRAQKDSVHASHSTVGSSIPTNRSSEGADRCSTAEANSKNIEHCLKDIDLETIPNGKGNFSNNSAELVPLSVSKNSFPCDTLSKKEEYSAPLSESIICRNNEDNYLPETDHGGRDLLATDPCELYGSSYSDRSKTLFGVQGKLESKNSCIKEECTEEFLNCAFGKEGADIVDGSELQVRKSQAYLQKNEIGTQHGESAYQPPEQGAGGSRNSTSCIGEDLTDTGVNCLVEQNVSDEIEGNMKLIGCYSHPTQISSVKIAGVGNEIYICVSCGPAEDRKRDLFLYRLSSKEPTQASPCMVGYTSMRLPSLKDEFGREVVIDKSGLQFTPDARGLVLTDSIRMPYCREKSLHCSCPQCESCIFEENAVKIVQIQHGYASLILKLNTIYPVHCILVCEPKCLVALDESGRIYIWIMDPTWSIKTEQHIIVSCDFLPSRIIELKRVPKSASMVIGHNGYGQFSLWDIAKRSVVTQFSSAASSVLEYLPVGLFRWQNKCLPLDNLLMEECVKKLVEETMMWFSGNNKVTTSCPMEGKDVALWVLMYTCSDSDVPPASFSSNYHSYSDGCWRLGLLVKSTIIMGAALPSSTAAIGTSAGIGIIGTHKGHVDLWELATGNTIGSLQNPAGKGVSHVTVDDSSSIVAIAHEGGQLSVYHHQ